MLALFTIKSVQLLYGNFLLLLLLLLSCSFMFLCLSGVHTVRVSEDEWYLLGTDSDGPDGAAS